ncbi:G1 family glutamic endopeptidase [Dictyobacter kobayashii]|uniref:Peptidase A4 family protein n=1 Tax=Dictyobacter kobayashii TaxID=2014872 RepID=A0A402AUM2_9CHLR|nr:G1 family glutamic endopeptidase [Dictyobacter kobayashii]GCE22765.1 hypothetical protein KDK_65650 [Dictyobacter kobayashii]
MRRSLIGLCCCLLLLVGCIPAPATTTQPLISAIHTSTATIATTPIATVRPLPTGKLPGWYQQSSILWSGYSAPQQGIQGVRAHWIEPQVSGQPGSNMFIWIGVGGWANTLNELVQIGTLAYTNDRGFTIHKVWYETVPQLSHETSMTVEAGDDIAAIMTLTAGSTQSWQLSLYDVTQHTSYSTSIDYPSHQVYADFIVEDPHLNSTDIEASLYPFQHFKTVKFTGAQVLYNNGWSSIGALRMMQISMQRNNQTIAYPSNITLPDSFNIIHT